MMNYSLNNTFVLTALDMGKERGAKQLVICKRKDGGIEVKGDWDKREVVGCLEKMISEEDALALHWVPKAEFPKLKMPMKELLKKPNEAKGLATKIFNLFLKENKAKYGIGKFDMWVYPIDKAYMVHTAPLLNGLPDTFRMDDIIDWSDLKGFNISNGPPANCLKGTSGVKTWLSAVKILLEFCLVVKGVDPDQWIVPPSSALPAPLPAIPATNLSLNPSLKGLASRSLSFSKSFEIIIPTWSCFQFNFTVICQQICWGAQFTFSIGCYSASQVI